MGNNEVQGLTGLGALKKWDDKTAEERIEILRQEVRDLRYLKNQIEYIERKVNSLQTHSHTDGKVTVDIVYADFYANDRSDAMTPRKDRLA